MMNDEMLQFEMNQFNEYKKIYDEDYERQIQSENNKKEEFEKEYLKNFREKDKKKLEDKMYKINPHVIEANLIA